MHQLQPQPQLATYSLPLEVGVKLPWRRKTRAKSVTAARLERQWSDRLNKEAQAIVRQLHDIRRENHFAEALRTLIEGGDS